ncbi:MAG: molybdopterin-guanine dinucleotide biosynthesis protein B [Gemmatirosa sp.]
MPRRPPMVAIVGRKHSGKTTLVVRLSAALTARGHRVMIVKHGHHTFDLDPSTTDTYRHYHEGMAERVVMAAPDKFALVMRWDEELSPEAIAERYLADADLVLCEGFKRAALPRIEVFREAAHAEPLYAPDAPDVDRWLAVVTDCEDVRSADGRATDGPLAGARVLTFAEDRWLDALVALVERDVMRIGAG